MPSHDGVSVVMPVLNGSATVQAAIAAIVPQLAGRPSEVLIVDDGSTDGSRETLAGLSHGCPLRLLDGPGRGAAAALNAGIRRAAYGVIAQIDQDVVVQPDWLERLLHELADPRVAAAQGHYVAAPDAPWPARVAGLDLALRYRRLGRFTTHVCTGNAVYRRDALERVGGFDESLGYGYDNDLSYRLTAAGYRLVHCSAAQSIHYWPADVRGYARQQYGQGYGRLDLVAKHPSRWTGDSVSPPDMMAQPAVWLGAIACGAAGTASLAYGGDAGGWFLAATSSASIAVAAACVAAVRAYRHFRDPAAWLLLPAHLVRNTAWTAAVAVWGARRLAGRARRPEHSMPARGLGRLPRP